MIIPVILSGGVGSRLWPLSRESYPKQLLALTGEQSLLQATITRIQDLPECADPIVIANEQHRFLTAEQLRQIDCNSQIILEPTGKNTAPAAAVAAFYAQQHYDDPVLLILPSDHVIQDHEAFIKALTAAYDLAKQDKLTTFGIVPTTPETGFGYIKRGDKVQDTLGFEVDQFVEKPDLKTAQQYLASGDYYWNSGMFMFKATVFLSQLQSLSPDIKAAAQLAFNRHTKDLDFIRLDKEGFEQCPSDSIDYAVMEKTTESAVVPLDANWNDIGSWSALWDISDKDDNNNVCKGNVITEQVKGSYLHAEHRVLAVLGMKDCVILETADAVLVASKNNAQDVKKIVSQLKQQNYEHVSTHRKVYRPWGTYELIDECTRFKVKRITVNPGQKLSLQSHQHRSEHWVVVKGSAEVTRNDDIVLLSENQSTYIPIGMKHSLKNSGNIPLEIIEVQSGSYLGEDDIVRYEDSYGRAHKNYKAGMEYAE